MKEKLVKIFITYMDGEIYSTIGTFDYDETLIVINKVEWTVIIPLNAVRRIEYTEWIP